MVKTKEPKCICETCPRRFICFTQERVYSDPEYQALFEGYVAQGDTKEEAIEKVQEFIEENKRVKELPHIDDEDWNSRPLRPLKPFPPDIWKKEKLPPFKDIPLKKQFEWYCRDEQIGETYPKYTRTKFGNE